MVVSFGDNKNAFQQSPPPSRQCYLEIDDSYESWYLKRFGAKIDSRKYVIPVNRAIQGHPEAGALFQTFITKILVDELGFKSTPHERNLYYGLVDGHETLVC
jgi:hypothetical protein